MNWIFTIIFVFAASIAFGQQTQDIYASICQGDTYTQNGFNESTTGVFTRTEDLGGGVTNTIILHLTVNPLPNVFISGSDNLCSGSASLTATNVTGGSGETYLWSNGATTSTNTVITAGTYSVTVTDANGCTASATKAVSEEANITFTVTTNNVSCYSRTDGSVSITNTSGGTAPYSYSWSNGSAGNIIANLSAGDYSVTISDANQCTAVSAIQITQPSEISVLSATTDASCTGVCDGKISCVANGGVPPLSLAWSNGGSLNELTSLCEGSYTLTVTDQHNCQITKTFDVGHRANMEAKATSKNVSCYGVSDGTITVSVTNGNPPYFYSIIENVNEDENNIIANLAAGEYTVYVKDSKGCTASTNAAITSPERLSVQYETTEISCKEASDGSIHLIISGGTAPYFVTTNNISEHELNDSAMVNGL
ncbi:MAG: SprB repeat-containing protein, partial [Bacteroidales bacterium]|nr:SprB repeat-containing protein [Bacteroidales bacterium]